MRVFISTGEASGDAYGAALTIEMRRLYHAQDAPGERGSLEFEGVGSSRMRNAGVQLVADSTRWGAISIVQALKVVPRALVGYLNVHRALASGNPGLFVPIDFGYANIRHARFAKRRGWKVLYFVPPGSWRRDRQGRDLPAVTDEICTPFSWSADMLNRMGASAHWFGHPIKQLFGAQSVPLPARDGIAILPGSREHEIATHLPLLAEAVDTQVEFALAPSLDAQLFQRTWEDLSGRTSDKYTVGDAGGVLRRARAAIVCSGTATLEAALCRTPMVVIYKLPKGTELEVKLLRIPRPKFVALPNILLDRSVVPELVQAEATPGNIKNALQALIVDGPERSAQLAAFEELDAVLGNDDAITQAAQLALTMI